MKKVAVIAIAVVAVFAVSSSATAGVKTNVTIDFFGDQYGGVFFGELDSNKNACVKSRKVRVRTTDAYGKELIGSDRTNAGGEYAVVDESVATADYRAIAKKKKIRNDKGKVKFVCEKGVSATISAP